MNTIIPRFNYNFSWGPIYAPPPPPLCIFNLTMVYNINCSVLLIDVYNVNMTYIIFTYRLKQL